jgi:hypothetical protein
MSEAFITYSPYVDNTTLSFSTGASSATTPQWVFAPAQINVVTPDDEERIGAELLEAIEEERHAY